jgi:D-arabinose 1-dehydrogenase-like Zn-dependent alcohol dehydrogenase
VSESLQDLGGVAVVLATAGNSQAMAATVGGLQPQGELVTVGITAEPLSVSPLQLITPGLSIIGHPSGTAKEVEDTMQFAVLTGVRAWIEELPLSQAAKGYATLQQGQAHYRTILTI